MYAPLQDRSHAVQRTRFPEATLALTHTLGMQVPILLMADFNGMFLPARDSTEAHNRLPCPLLANVLGPGGAWIDVHATLLQAPVPWTFHSLGESQQGASCIELISANHSALPLVRSAEILTDIRDGAILKSSSRYPFRPP